MKHRDSVRRTAGSGDSRWWTVSKSAAVVAVGALAVGWGIGVDADPQAARPYRLPESRSGEWISSLPLEVAEAPPVLNTTEPERMGQHDSRGPEGRLYPAVRFTPLHDVADSMHFDSIVRPWYVRSPDDTAWMREHYGRDPLVFSWAMSEPHALLDSLLPGTRMLVLTVHRADGLHEEAPLFCHQGRLYDPRDFNYLLAAAGVSFHINNQLTVARLAVLAGILDRGVRDPGSSSTEAFPRLEILAVERGIWVNPKSEAEVHGIWLRCLVGGKAQDQFVGFRAVGQPDVLVPFQVRGLGSSSLRFHVPAPDEIVPPEDGGRGDIAPETATGVPPSR